PVPAELSKRSASEAAAIASGATGMGTPQVTAVTSALEAKPAPKPASRTVAARLTMQGGSTAAFAVAAPAGADGAPSATPADPAGALLEPEAMSAAEVAMIPSERRAAILERVRRELAGCQVEYVSAPATLPPGLVSVSTLEETP